MLLRVSGFFHTSHDRLVHILSYRWLDIDIFAFWTACGADPPLRFRFRTRVRTRVARGTYPIRHAQAPNAHLITHGDIL